MDGGIRPRSPDAALLREALNFPWRGAPLLTNGVYTALRVLAAYLPIYGLGLHALLTLGFYAYAFECLAAAAHGRRDTPEWVVAGDERLRRRHLLLQASWLLLLVLAIHFLAPRTAGLVLGGIALMLPGALVTLLVAQNLPAALDPRSWAKVAARLGLRYALFSGMAFGLFTAQALLGPLLDVMPSRALAVVLFHFALQAAILMLFRGLGTAVRDAAGALGFEPDAQTLPTLARDREQAQRGQELAAARSLAEPAARAAALAPLLTDATDEALHREYRQTLRRVGDVPALAAHARVHTCELVALRQWRPALALASEALQDDPRFTLPEAPPLEALLEAAERAGLYRQAAALAANYGEAFPRRHDALPLLRRAARHYADRLEEPARARALLETGAARAGDGPEGDEFRRLLARFGAGLPLEGGEPR